MFGPSGVSKGHVLPMQKLFVNEADRPRQMQGEMEYWALRNARAHGAIAEMNGGACAAPRSLISHVERNLQREVEGAVVLAVVSSA